MNLLIILIGCNKLLIEIVMGGCNSETEARQCPEHSFDRAASRNMHLNLVAKYIGVLCIIFPILPEES